MMEKQFFWEDVWDEIAQALMTNYSALENCILRIYVLISEGLEINVH